MKKTLIELLLAAAVLLPAASLAQTSSINAFSPYTLYGIGELNTPGTLPMRSMGGVGVAMRSGGTVNLLNPAAYSVAPQKTFLFNFGLEGQNYYNAQRLDGVNRTTAYNTFNFHDVAFQLPLAKRLGLGFSLTPYSSTGYRIKGEHAFDASDPVWGNVGRVGYVYEGEGDVTEVKLGVGWELFKNFSLGVAVQYYWGDIDRHYTMTPTPTVGDGTYLSMIGRDNYSVSSFKGQVGIQWNLVKNTRRILTFGAAYDFGGDLRPEATRTITGNDNFSTLVKGDTTHLRLRLPRQLQAGFFYQTPKWTTYIRTGAAATTTPSSRASRAPMQSPSAWPTPTRTPSRRASNSSPTAPTCATSSVASPTARACATATTTRPSATTGSRSTPSRWAWACPSSCGPSRPSTSASNTAAAATTSPSASGWCASSISSSRWASPCSPAARTSSTGSCVPSTISGPKFANPGNWW